MPVYADTVGSSFIGAFTTAPDYEYYFLDGDDAVTMSGLDHAYVDLGTGNDWLHWQSPAFSIVDGGPGNDTIYGGANFNHLSGGYHNDMLFGGGSLDIMYGGSGADILYGGDSGDYLYGDDGDDTLNGQSGIDHLYGGYGNDVLKGDGDNDRMSGDDGDDHYEVGEKGDRVLEHKGEGHDAIFSFVSFTLSANVEDMILLAGNDIDAKGNGLANVFAGNPGDNVIKGMGGSDSLYGAGGRDVLDGGSGKDYFSFAEMGTANADKIKNFSHKHDTILLERDVFVDIENGVGWQPIKADQFRAHASGKAADRQDRILYDTTDGKLYYDRDGSGTTYSRHFIAVIDGHPSSISSNDFMIA